MIYAEHELGVLFELAVFQASLPFFLAVRSTNIIISVLKLKIKCVSVPGNVRHCEEQETRST